MKKEYLLPEWNVVLLIESDVFTASTDENQPSKDDPFTFSVDRYWKKR